jgi:DNA-binding Lrp family transcriptional regulator
VDKLPEILVIFLDALDKQLWIELSKNCRVSYKFLADKLGISANAVKHRVDKLLETGLIKDWYVCFQPAMIDAQFAFIEVSTDGSCDEESMIEILGNNPMIYVVLPLTTGDYILHAFYIGASGLLELGSFIRSVGSVKDVKVHPTTAGSGEKMELNPLHLRVLRWLAEDPRASISDIARNTGLTARRVRRIIDELVSSNAFDISFIWNPNAGDSLAFISKIRYDSKETRPKDVSESIHELYPLEYFYSHVSAIETVMFSVFMVDHLFDVQQISRQLRKLHGVKALSTMIYYSATVLDPPTRVKMMELLSEI